MGFNLFLNFVIRTCLVAFISLFSIQCTFKTLTGDTPPPNEQNVPKAFFFKNVGTDGSASLPTSKLEPKTFLCGWASEREVGWVAESEVLHNHNQAYGCNIEFEITEFKLIGRLVNPNYLNDRSQWEQVIEIPIEQHYYYEPAKDNYGRNTNTTVKNSERSHWSRRPYMKLNFSGLRITKWSFTMVSSFLPIISNVYDIEWDHKDGFLGFNVSVSGFFGQSSNQAEFRFNFKSFESKPDFKKTYFPVGNSRFINAVFAIGQQAEDLSPIYYLAKWDLSRSHEILLVNFPNETMETAAQEVLEGYNEVLTKIVKPDFKGIFPFFKGIPHKSNHPFDIRKPAITWVADRSISARSPLGVAYVNPDLRTGEVLWGGLTLWGGGIEDYIRHYSPGSVLSSQKSFNEMKVIKGDPAFPAKLNAQSIDGSDFGDFRINTQALVQDSFDQLFETSLRQLGLDYQTSNNTLLYGDAESLAAAINSKNQASDSVLSPTKIEEINQRILEFQSTSRSLGENLSKGLSLALSQLATDSRLVQNEIRNVVNPFKFPIESSPEILSNTFGSEYEKLDYNEMVGSLLNNHEGRINGRHNGWKHDTERTFFEVAQGWNEGIMAAQAKDPMFDREKALIIVIKALLSHEFGHVLGLGHNFRGNILPPKDKVPKNIFAKLEKKAKSSDLSTQSVSIMDYYDGRAEVNLEDEDTLPQIQDIQVLNYIYGNRYPVAVGESDYIYKNLPANFEIPSEQSYLTQCNDLRATIGDDPYCDRWDAGFDARTIVTNRLINLENGLIHSLFALDQTRSGNPERAESMLWSRSMRETSRVRTFYDHMRERLNEERPEFLNKLIRNQEALLNFSAACSDNPVNGVKFPKLLSDFFSNPENLEFKELCQINKLVVEKFADLLSLDGLDHTDISYRQKDQYVVWTRAHAVGGSWGHALGSWKELSIFPLKYTALINLTTPTPYTMLGGWIMPIPKYASFRSRALMSTLYPNEFTRAMGVAVNKNLKVATTFGEETTHIGLPVLAMGSLLSSMRGANDALRLTDTYKDLLRRQTEFYFNPSQDIVAILMEGRYRDDSDQQRITHFSTKLYDFRAGTMAERNMKNAYILEDGKVVVDPPPNTFLLPITDFQWANNKSGYVIALRIKVSDNLTDPLAQKGVRFDLSQLNQDIVEKCIIGEKNKQNGLQDFFIGREDNKDSYPGLDVNSRVAESDEHLAIFYDSLKDMHNRYYSFFDDLGKPVDPNVCQETLKGISLTASTALVINGWWLPQTWDHYLKNR